MIDIAELRDAYAKKLSALRRAKKRLWSLLNEVMSAIDDKTLVRAELDGVRPKSLTSLAKKARRKGWNAGEAFLQCGDLLGGRVVCNNKEDVYRFAELLKERIPWHSGSIEIEDYVKEPKEGGYRALHVNFRLDVGEPLNPEPIPCEVQIRTRLQDAWGKLSHVDIYKQPDLPQDLRDRFEDLGRVLAAADDTATRIRERVSQKTATPDLQPELSHVTTQGLAFVFKNAFGRSPADYVIRQGLDLCEELGVASIERLSHVLARGELRAKLDNIYRSIVGVPLNNEEIFLGTIHALAGGDGLAKNAIRRKARRDWCEIEQIATREMLSSLPDTVDELIETIEDPTADADLENWADALGATDVCHICGTTIVKPFTFAEAVVHHCGLRGERADAAHQRIEQAVRSCGVETGGWDESSLCSYHEAQAAKDD